MSWRRWRPEQTMTQILRLIVISIAFLPQNVSDRIAVALARLFYLFDRKGKKVLFHNIASIYHLAAQSSFAKTFALQVYRLQLLTAFDSIRVLLRPDSIELRGLDDYIMMVRDLQKQGPVVACTAHLGAWELAGYCCARASEHGFVALAKTQRSKVVANTLDWLRLKFCSQVLLVEKGSLLKDVIRALQRGDLVGFVADQKPIARQGIEVDFLGKCTPFVSGPAKFAAKTRAAIVCIYVVRVATGVYQVVYDRKESLEPSDDAGLSTATQWISNSMTRAIRLYPEQWAWTYKRWQIPQK